MPALPFWRIGNFRVFRAVEEFAPIAVGGQKSVARPNAVEFQGSAKSHCCQVSALIPSLGR
jgi:hypothetical protein